MKDEMNVSFEYTGQNVSVFVLISKPEILISLWRSNLFNDLILLGNALLELI